MTRCRRLKLFLPHKKRKKTYRIFVILIDKQMKLLFLFIPKNYKFYLFLVLLKLIISIINILLILNLKILKWKLFLNCNFKFLHKTQLKFLENKDRKIEQNLKYYKMANFSKIFSFNINHKTLKNINKYLKVLN